MKLLFENWRKWLAKDKDKKKNKKAAEKAAKKRTAPAKKSLAKTQKTLDAWKRFDLEESLYFGTSTTFQQEITENGIKAPSEWGNYGLAEESAFKIVEEHGGEPVIIQIPLSEFKKEHFLLDENNAVTIVYTEDLPIFMEKQQQKLL